MICHTTSVEAYNCRLIQSVFSISIIQQICKLSMSHTHTEDLLAPQTCALWFLLRSWCICSSSREIADRPWTDCSSADTNHNLFRERIIRGYILPRYLNWSTFFSSASSIIIRGRLGLIPGADCYITSVVYVYCEPKQFCCIREPVNDHLKVRFRMCQ